jgi:hypothetical protein
MIGQIERCIGGGIYDKEPVYAAVEKYSPVARVIILPCKDAVLSPLERLRRRNAISKFRRSRATVDLYGNERLVTTHRVTRRTPFRDSNEHSEAGYGRSEMRRRSGKPRWLASCSIGCWNWGVLSPIRSAKSGVQGNPASFADL